MSRDQEVLNALLAKLYAVLNAGDTVNPNAPVSADSTFVSFMSPGIAIDPSDLSFGFSPTDADITSASSFAELVDIIPMTKGFWSASGARLSDVYDRVLREAVVADSELSPAEQTQLSNANKILWTTSLIPNLEGGTDEAVNDTPFAERVAGLKQLYDATLMAYNNRLINVQTNPNNPLAVADFNINGPIYKAQVQVAYQKYIAAGGNTIVNAANLIGQLSGRDPKRVFGEARQRMDTLKRLDLAGEDYYFTKFIPSHFWSAASWPKYTFTSQEVHSVDTSTSTAWGGGGSIGFGLWSFGASASYSSTKTQSNSDASNLALEVELIRIPIRRSWFVGSILTSRAWKAGFELSDGGLPPKGEMPLYTTELIVARNLKITMDMSSTADATSTSSFSTSASIGWGPFSLRGNYSSSSSSRTHDFSLSGGAIVCPGLQIIGMVCRTLPKAPNPDPNLHFSS